MEDSFLESLSVGGLMKANRQKFLGKRLLCFRCRRRGLLSLQCLLFGSSSLLLVLFTQTLKLSMRTSCLAILLLSSILAGAQTTGTTTQTTPGQPALPAATAFSPVSRDARSTVWERTVYEQGPNGTVVPKKHRYTELASGLNYQDPATGQWQPSRAEISLLPPGGAFAAAATHGRVRRGSLWT